MKEQHDQKRGFRGCWAPAELFDWLEDGVIEPIEMVLLLIIDSFVQSNPEKEESFASNAYLGSRLKREPTQVSRYITRLKEMGLLVESNFDGRRRFLRTQWSRLTKGGEEPTQGCIALKRKAALRKNANIVLEAEKNTLSAPPKGGLPTETDTSRKTGKSDKPVDKRWMTYARMLASTITKVHKINCTSSLKGWARDIELLHTVNNIDTKRIKKALQWFDINLPIHYRDRFLPIINSGSTFRKKFTNLEAAMERFRDKDDEESTSTSDDGEPEVKVTAKYIDGVLEGKAARDFLEQNG